MLRFNKYSSSRYLQKLISTRTSIQSFHYQRHYSQNNKLQDLDLSDIGGIISPSILSKEASVAPVDFPSHDRWKVVLPAAAVHLSIGSVYVYSMWTPGLTTALGIVGSAPLDWTYAEVLPVFSTAAVTLGVTTSLMGTWIEKSGPRKAGVVGSLFWSGALCTSAIGVHYHSLPLLYLGYGVLGGIGWGLLYLAPVTSVMKFFPDRRGLATGLSLSAFGAGAALAPSLIDLALDYFFISPDFVGTLTDTTGIALGGNNVELETLRDGSQVISESSPVGQAGQKVIVATETDISRLNNLSTGAGVYSIGSGDTGTSKALATLGVCYGTLGIMGSLAMKTPHPNWSPQTNGAKNETASNSKHYIETGLPSSYVTKKTLQFPLLWLSVFGNATGGLALLSSSKLMLTDIWAGIAPDIVTSSFTTGYVSALGLGMAAGRFGWSALSDYLGRRQTYALFGLGIPIVAMAPSLCQTAISNAGASQVDTVYPLLLTFYGGSVLAITFYGGLFSVLPAYIADLFGQKHAGSIHGKALTAWAASAVAGPMGLAYLRSQSIMDGTKELLQSITDEEAFEAAFGCHLNDNASIESLIDAKTMTIPRLMELVPENTIDPTPFLYDSSCYAAAALMTLSALANFAIRPIDMTKEELRVKEERK